MGRFLFCGIAAFLVLFSSQVWSQISASPNPSTTGNVTLSWSLGGVTAFVYQSKDGGNSSLVYNGNASSYALSGLSVGSYEFSLFRMQTGSECNYFVGCLPVLLGSVTVPVSLPAVPGVPGSISGPSTTQNTISYTVSWGASSGTVTSYELQERANGGAWSTVQNSTARSRSFTKSTGVYHDYRVRACNQGACSGYTGTKRVTVPSASVSASVSPASLQYTTDFFTLSWSSSMTTGCGWSAGSISGTSGSTSASLVSGWSYDDYIDIWMNISTLTCNVMGGGTVTETVGQFAQSLPPKPTVNVSWNKSSMLVTESATLSWSTSNADSCSLDGGSVSTSGSRSFSFSSGGTKTKTVICTNAQGNTSKSASITVNLPPKPTLNVSWNASSAYVGESATLSWSSSGADSCVLDNSNVSGSGSRSYTLNSAGSTNKMVTCTNLGGSTSQTDSISVIYPAPTMQASVSSSDENFGVFTNVPFTLSWSSTNTSGCRYWDAKGGPVDVSGQPSNGQVSLNGSQLDWDYLSLQNEAVISVSCTGLNGTVLQQDRLLTAFLTGAPVEPTVTLSWDRSTALIHEQATVSWTVDSATSCTMDGEDVPPVSGSEVVSLSTAGVVTRNLQCSNSKGSDSASASITVNLPAAPTVTMSWSPASVTVGGASTLSWSAVGADSCSMNGVDVNTSGSQLHTLSLAGQQERSITCSNIGGSTTETATADVLRPTIPQAANDPANDTLEGASYIGQTRGEFSVGDSGSFKYSVPIQVAPGINGVQPKLAIEYSSEGLNGPLGWGWQLSGVSSISRCPATIATDGFSSGINAGDNYRFCLDDQRLVFVGGNEYRTEVESFQRVTYISGTWMVEAQDGSRRYFGSDANSRSVDAANTPIQWFIDRHEDVSGNYMSYQYASDAQGAGKHISTISYTQNDSAPQGTDQSIDFIYEARPDVSEKFVANTLFRRNTRLSRVEAKSHGNVVYAYVLDYATVADPAETSRMESITQCYAGISVCANPITLDWTGVSASHYSLSSSDPEYLVAEDIASEGYVDLSLSFEDLFNTSQIFPNGMWPESREGLMALAYEGVRGDFDGDGLNERIWVDCGGAAVDTDSVCARRVAMSSTDAGTAFVTRPVYETIVTSYSSGNGSGQATNTSTRSRLVRGRVLDINQDGLDDYYIQTLNGLDVYLSNGSTLVLSSEYSKTRAQLGIIHASACCAGGMTHTQDWTYSLYFVDVTGDRLLDLVRVPVWATGDHLNMEDLGIVDISVAVNLGDADNNGVSDGFGDFTQWATSTDFSALDAALARAAYRFMDVDSDGLADLVGLNGEVGLNSGTAFVRQSQWSANIGMPSLPEDEHIHVSVSSVGVDPISGFSNGHVSGSVPVEGYDENAFIYERSHFNPLVTTTTLADVNGDGSVDLVALRGDGVYVSISDGSQFLPVQRWSEAFNQSFVKPYCDMMECNTARRGMFVQDVNKDGLADVVLTEADFYEAGTKVSVLFSRGHFDGNVGFTDPVVVVDTTGGTNVTGYSANVQAHNKIGKPHVTAEGELVLHFQDEFSESWVTTQFPMTRMEDTAVNVGIQRHQLLALHEGSVRSLAVQYAKLSNDEVYSQSFNGLDQSLFQGMQYQTHYHAISQAGGFSRVPDSSFPAAFRGRHVVAQVDVNVLGQLSEQQEYHYRNQRRSRSGFGALGFEQVTQTTTLTGFSEQIRSVKHYDQEIDPYNAYALVAPKKTTRCVITSVAAEGCDVGPHVQLLSENQQNWKVRVYDHASTHYFPYLLDEQTRNYDQVTGELLNTVRKRVFDDGLRTSCPSFSELSVTNRTTDSDEHFDAYGTPLDIVENRCDSYGVTGIHTENDNVLNDTTNWCLNLTQDAKVHSWIYDNDAGTTETLTRQTDFQYHSSGDGKCQVSRKIREPSSGDNAIWLREDYEYNAYGTRDNVQETVRAFTHDGLGYTQRSTSLVETYGTDGRRTVVTTNAENHTSTQIYNADFGSLDHSLDANDLPSIFDYDVLGRLTQNESLGVITTYEYRNCDNCFSYNNDAAYYAQEKIEGQSATRTYYDGLDREVGTRWRGLNGDFYHTGQRYTRQGLPEYQSEPYGELATSHHDTRTHYDVLGRVIRTDFPTGAHQTVSYTAVGGVATVVTTDTADHSTTQHFDALGREKLVRDALNIEVRYQHDAQGNVTDIRVATQNGNHPIDHQIQFDILGRKTRLIDPDVGSIDYTYNAFGHLATQTNSENERSCYTYDRIDRQLERRDSGQANCNGSLHTWEYDRDGELGLLSRVSGVDTKGRVQSETYTYTLETLLPEMTTHLIDGESFSVISSYDDFNRPVGFSYPTGFTLEQRYNAYGHAYQSVNAASGEVLWEATEDDVRGNVTQLNYGNGALVQSAFTPETGLLETRSATLGTSTLQHHSYSFDNEGNLRSREDHRVNLTQNFCYDPLYRLTDQVINSGCADDTNGSYSGTAYAYDIHGNLTRKDGISDYQYGQSAQNAGPHAVSFANGSAYHYDDAGRLTGNHDRVIEYSLFGKPTYMGFSSGYQTEVTYGALQKRVQRGDVENGQLTTTTYVEKFYERIDKPGGVREHRHYLSDWGVHVINEADSESYNVYFTRDHIGSLASKSDDRASTTVRYHANEPWGRRQDQHWNGTVYDTLEGAELEAMTFGTTRGFTDHEHLDGVGLIHMNGRVYDPVVGRFVSPDPWIQDPKNSQSFNRYTYVWNNPLRYTDPTGEFIPVIIVAVKIVGWGMAAYGLYDGATTVAENVTDVALGEKTVTEAAKDGAKQLAIDTALTVTGTRAVKVADKLADKYAPDAKKKAMDAVSDAVDQVTGNKEKTTGDLNSSASVDNSGSVPDSGSAPKASDPVAPGDEGTYGDLKARKKANGETEPLDMDHRPSFAAQKKSLENELGRELSPSEAKDLKNNTPAVATPRKDHQQKSRTYGGRNTKEKINADAKDLDKARLLDDKAIGGS